MKLQYGALPGLTLEEQQALVRARRAGFLGSWVFLAPDGCRSLEQWARDGEQRWDVVKAKLRQALPTASGSPMLASLETRFGL
jgi:hypothetical protein